jgi:hypothetical protein
MQKAEEATTRSMLCSDEEKAAFEEVLYVRAKARTAHAAGADHTTVIKDGTMAANAVTTGVIECELEACRPCAVVSVCGREVDGGATYTKHESPRNGAPALWPIWGARGHQRSKTAPALCLGRGYQRRMLWSCGPALAPASH